MAESSGIEKLTFRYLRPWEKNAEPARTVTFRVAVK
jgi:predicted secreted protein